MTLPTIIHVELEWRNNLTSCWTVRQPQTGVVKEKDWLVLWSLTAPA